MKAKQKKEKKTKQKKTKQKKQNKKTERRRGLQTRDKFKTIQLNPTLDEGLQREKMTLTRKNRVIHMVRMYLHGEDDEDESED